MNILLLGPSGAGKGTLAPRLLREFPLIHISTGDLFHHNLEKKTALGLIARNYMRQGELVPDEVVDAMVEEWFQNVPDQKGILFDGFPRTLEQAKFLDEVFRQQNRHLDAAIYLDVSDELVVERLTGRLICTVCNSPYHKKLKPPSQSLTCDSCGRELYQRWDDRPELIQARLRTFHRSMGPVLEHYQEMGRLAILETEGELDDIYQKMADVLTHFHPSTKEEIFKLPAFRSTKPSPKKEVRPSLDLVLLGGPGSGKGTQAEHLCPVFGIPHLSTGDLFRENVKKETDLGKLAKSYMDRGELVPDSVTESMVEKRLSQQDTQKGFVLDGFPRTLPQAQALDEMLYKMGRRLAGAIAIEVSDEEILNRLTGRRICPKCQAIWHLKFKPTAREGICDLCGGRVEQRNDDKPDTIRSRLKTYHAQSRPLLEFYRKNNHLIQINGEEGHAVVTQKVLEAAKFFAPNGNLKD